MFLHNNTYLLTNFEQIFYILNGNNINLSYNCKYIYENKLALEHLIINNEIKEIKENSENSENSEIKENSENSENKNINIVRIWRTFSIFDIFYTKYENCGKNFIACMDYIINEDYIKIKHLGINDSDVSNIYDNFLEEDDAEDLIKELIKYLKIIAKVNSINKIVMDVHQNLRIYEKYYNYLGFQLTNKKCLTNPYWVETQLMLN